MISLTSGSSRLHSCHNQFGTKNAKNRVEMSPDCLLVLCAERIWKLLESGDDLPWNIQHWQIGQWGGIQQQWAAPKYKQPLIPIQIEYRHQKTAEPGECPSGGNWQQQKAKRSCDASVEIRRSYDGWWESNPEAKDQPKQGIAANGQPVEEKNAAQGQPRMEHVGHETKGFPEWCQSIEANNLKSPSRFWKIQRFTQRIPSHPEGVGCANSKQNNQIVPKLEVTMPKGEDNGTEPIQRGQKDQRLAKVECQEWHSLGDQTLPEGASVSARNGIPRGLQQMQMEDGFTQSTKSNQPMGRRFG